MFSPLAVKYPALYQELLKGIASHEQLGNRLVKLAEQAHAFRQFDKVAEIGQTLSNFSIGQYRAIGHYFLAVGLNSKGEGDQDRARTLFESAVDCAPDIYKRKAILSLAAVSFNKREFDSALYFYRETIKTGLNLSALQAVAGISLLKSMEGRHGSALKDLENLYPLFRYAPPGIHFDYLNSLAFELGEVGRKQEGRDIIRHVLASPFAFAYPEWKQTAKDLKGSSRSFAVIDPPAYTPRSVLLMPATELSSVEIPSQSDESARVIDMRNWKTRRGNKMSRDKQKPKEEMNVRDRFLRIMEIYGSEETTDEQRYRIWEAVEKIASEAVNSDKVDDDKGEA
jgi:tetratricopeptide (TPR) repeat protein